MQKTHTGILALLWSRPHAACASSSDRRQLSAELNTPGSSAPRKKAWRPAQSASQCSARASPACWPSRGAQLTDALRHPTAAENEGGRIARHAAGGQAPGRPEAPCAGAEREHAPPGTIWRDMRAGGTGTLSGSRSAQAHEACSAQLLLRRRSSAVVGHRLAVWCRRCKRRWTRPHCSSRRPRSSTPWAAWRSRMSTVRRCRAPGQPARTNAAGRTTQPAVPVGCPQSTGSWRTVRRARRRRPQAPEPPRALQPASAAAAGPAPRV